MTDENQRPQYCALDRSAANLTHLTTTVVGLATLLGYTGALLLVTAIRDSPIGLVLFVALQLAVGLPGTRLAHQAGLRARRRTVLIDPATLQDGWARIEEPVTPAGIPHIFEGLQSSTRESSTDRPVDDLNDLAWFAIVVTMMLSTLALWTGVPSLVAALAGPIALSTASTATYINGYSTPSGQHLDQVLDHLEFIVTSRLQQLDQLRQHADITLATVWLQKGTQRVLCDFTARLSCNDTTAYYALGIPSDRCEALRITLHNSAHLSTLDTTLSPLTTSDPPWSLTTSRHSTPADVPDQTSTGTHDQTSTVTLTNPALCIDLTHPQSVLLSPSTVEDSSRRLLDALARLVTTVGFGP